MSDKEVKGPNRLTTEAGLILNVNTMKKALKPYFKERLDKVPIIKKGHVYLTAVVEEMCKMILDNVKAHCKKNKSGLEDVNRASLKYSVQLNRDFDNFFHMFIQNLFDEDMDYSVQFPFTKSEMDTLIEKKGGKDLNLSAKAVNLLYFMLVKTYLECARIATQFIIFAKKKTIDEKGIRAAVKVLFGETQLAENLDKEIVRVFRLINDVKEDKEDKDENNDEEEEEEEEEEDEEDDEDEDEEEEDDEEEDEEEDEDDEEEEAKSKSKDKKKDGKKSANKSTKPKKSTKTKGK